MLYAEVSKINNLHYYEHRLPNGDYIIDVKDKIIISDGEHYRPTIKGIVELASYKNQVWIARDYFYENISNGRTIQECIEFINRVCQEEVASLYGYDDGGRNSQVNRQRQVAEDDRNGDARVEERARDGRQTRKNVDDDGTRHSLRQPILPNSVEEDVIARYGKTYQWSETGYITPSGVRIDLSGKNEGGRGGYRAIDHRDIFDEYDVDGVIRKMTKSDPVKRNEYIKEINQEAADRGHGSREVFERLGVELDNDSRDDVGRELRKDDEFAQKRTDDNEGETSEGVEYRRSKRVGSDDEQHSLRSNSDSEGRTLTPEQRAYFADSKVVDEQGCRIE